MLTKSDLKWLKENLATKEDLKSFASKTDLKKMEKRLDKKFIDLFDLLDKDVMDHKQRLNTIEGVLKISTI